MRSFRLTDRVQAIVELGLRARVFDLRKACCDGPVRVFFQQVGGCGPGCGHIFGLGTGGRPPDQITNAPGFETIGLFELNDRVGIPVQLKIDDARKTDRGPVAEEIDPQCGRQSCFGLLGTFETQQGQSRSVLCPNTKPRQSPIKDRIKPQGALCQNPSVEKRVFDGVFVNLVRGTKPEHLCRIIGSGSANFGVIPRVPGHVTRNGAR